jgi:hypothetical protein
MEFAGHRVSAPQRISRRTVSDEVEAEVVGGLLRSPLHRIASDGTRVILVHESDLEASRALLADARR